MHADKAAQGTRPSMGNHYAGFLPPAECRWDVRPTYYSPDVPVIHHCLPCPHHALEDVWSTAPKCVRARVCACLLVCSPIALFKKKNVGLNCNCESFFMYMYTESMYVHLYVCCFIILQSLSVPHLLFVSKLVFYTILIKVINALLKVVYILMIAVHIITSTYF